MPKKIYALVTELCDEAAAAAGCLGKSTEFWEFEDVELEPTQA